MNANQLTSLSQFRAGGARVRGLASSTVEGDVDSRVQQLIISTDDEREVWDGLTKYISSARQVLVPNETQG